MDTALEDGNYCSGCESASGLSTGNLLKGMLTGSMVAFVNAALYFWMGVELSIVPFTLKKVSGVWLIDLAVIIVRMSGL